MIRCIAIDDEPLALTQISGYIKKTPYLTFVAGCPSCKSAMEVLSKEEVDLIFADINMPDLSGMDFIKTLNGKYMVIFTTAYSEYAIEGYKVDALDYLLKPFSYKDFYSAANKAVKHYDLIHGVQPKEVNEDDDAIFIKNDYKMMKLVKSTITYIEGESEYVRIHLEDGKSILYLSSMKSIIEKLSDPRFLRVHRSYIVNTARIREVASTQVSIFISDQKPLQDIPIGDQYRDNLRSWFFKHN